MIRFVPLAFSTLCLITQALGQPLKVDPTPSDYVERNGSGTIVPAGQMQLDGHALACGRAATILDPELNDYAASYPRFVILNDALMSKIATPVKLWIYGHECAHVSGIRDESEADCFSIHRGLSQKWLTPDGLDQICAFIDAGQADAKHFGGPQRCAIMRQCYAQHSEKAAHARPPSVSAGH